MIKESLFFFSLWCFLVGSGELSATTWDVNYPESHLGFIGHQGAAEFQGKFTKFQVAVDFDKSKPDAGTIRVDIDMGSATTADDERDGYLPQPDWFNVPTFPKAQFVSTKLHDVGSDKTNVECYEAQGILTIKAISRPLTLPFCLLREGDHWRAKGKTMVNRIDFHVGEHDWADENFVKDSVDILVDLSLKPTP